MDNERRFRRCRAAVALLALLCLGPGLQADEPNLVINGNVEKGAGKQPAGWSKLDGITSLWDKNGRSGRCLRFNTAVLQVDKKKFLEAPDQPPPKSKGGQYQTVGAHEGVWAFSAPIEVRDDDKYFVLEVDVKGPARSTRIFYPQVFIRGYNKYSRKRDGEKTLYMQTPHADGPAYSEMFGKQAAVEDGDYLQAYRHSLVCRLPDTKWNHFQLAVKLPKTKRYRPERLLIKCYAMWPLGDYYFDNIVFRRVDKAEHDRVKKIGHSAVQFR